LLLCSNRQIFFAENVITGCSFRNKSMESSHPVLFGKEAFQRSRQYREGERHRSELLVWRPPFVNPGGDNLPQGRIHRGRPDQKPKLPRTGV
jgi:hypothetical protein